jgi:sugar/nucleoside kinase (ribokinase family)
MKKYDFAFIGHTSINQIIPFEGSPKSVSGGAVTFAAMTAAALGKRTALITKAAKRDKSIFVPLKEKGVDVFPIPSEETTHLRLIYPSQDIDFREIYQEKNAGPITMEKMPAIDASFVHLCPVTNQDFTLDLMRSLKEKGYHLSIDMQGFVRHLDPVTLKIQLGDAPGKEEAFALAERVKLDVQEAKLLTGTEDLEKAALILEDLGSRETMITRSDGVLLRCDGKTYFEKFRNRYTLGRTGRGDTTFTAYISRRMDHGPLESLKFAAAVASIKLETPGPFEGSVEEVIRRMEDPFLSGTGSVSMDATPSAIAG